MRVAAAIAAGVFVIATGCTSGASASPSAVPTATPAGTPTDTASPLPNLPAEIIGSWETDLREFHEDPCLPCGPVVSLVIEETGVVVIARSGGTSFGHLSVEDRQLVFGPNSRCDGTGTYTWRADAQTLTLTAVEPDQCPPRAEALDGPTYTRSE